MFLDLLQILLKLKEQLRRITSLTISEDPSGKNKQTIISTKFKSDRAFLSPPFATNLKSTIFQSLVSLCFLSTEYVLELDISNWPEALR